MTTMNGELRIGMHVIFHHNSRNENLDALIKVIFPQNGSHPHLSLIMIRPGERGETVRTMIPHRDDMTKIGIGYWMTVEDMDS